VDGDFDSVSVVDMGAYEMAPCIDTDGDGYGVQNYNRSCPHQGVDCDDTDPEVHPGAEEICDGIDNNCDRQVDEEPAASNNCQNESLCDGQEYCSSELAMQGMRSTVTMGTPAPKTHVILRLGVSIPQ